MMVGLFLEVRNTTWGQGFQFHRPRNFCFMWKGHHHDIWVNALNSFKVLFWRGKSIKIPLAMYGCGYMLTKCHSAFFCYILRCYIRDPYPIQTTPISMPTTLETEKQSLLPQCNFPHFHLRCGTQIGKPPPVRYVLRMTERSRGLENPSLMELTRGGGGTRWLMETRFG